MSFSFDTSLSSYKDKVRVLAGDMTENADSFGDEEIAALENIEPNLFLGAAIVARGIGMKVARRAIEFDTAANVQGGLRVDRRQQPEWWFKQAQALENRATNPAMNADEIINSFDFDIDKLGIDWSDYGESLTVSAEDRTLWLNY